MSESSPDISPDTVARLRATAQRIRRDCLTMIHRAQLGHPGGDLSATDAMTTLFFHVMRYDPARPDWADRDRFVLSKGHAAASLYATLAAAGFFPSDQLGTFMEPLSQLNGHPDRNKVRGVEANTGPLGHGLPVAVGMALAAKLDGRPSRTFVLTGDGELQEGSNWEAAMAAAHYGLDRLIVIVDRNRLQQGDATEQTVRLDPLAARWAAFGFSVAEVDGHDYRALAQALTAAPGTPGTPTCIIANTHKGRGVSFMEDRVEWHHRVPNDAEFAQALREIDEAGR